MDILNSAGFLDIQKWIFGYPKIHWFFDIQKWIMDIQKSNYRYPQFSMIFGNVFLDILKYTDFWISKNRIMDIQNSAWLLDIQKCIFMYFWISKNDLWISKNRFVDILKYIFGYPKKFLISIIILWYPKFIFGYPKMNYGYPKMNYGYPKMNFWYPYIGNK